MRRSPQSRIRYEITSANSVAEHAQRKGINGTNERTRIIPYRPVRLEDYL